MKFALCWAIILAGHASLERLAFYFKGQHIPHCYSKEKIEFYPFAHNEFMNGSNANYLLLEKGPGVIELKAINWSPNLQLVFRSSEQYFIDFMKAMGIKYLQVTTSEKGLLIVSSPLTTEDDWFRFSSILNRWVSFVLTGASSPEKLRLLMAEHQRLLRKLNNQPSLF